jgi:hypothetical protein
MTSAEGFKRFSNIRGPERFVAIKFRGEYVGYTSTQEARDRSASDHRNLGMAKYVEGLRD